MQKLWIVAEIFEFLEFCMVNFAHAYLGKGDRWRQNFFINVMLRAHRYITQKISPCYPYGHL
jgi:hypothetical protein